MPHARSVVSSESGASSDGARNGLLLPLEEAAEEERATVHGRVPVVGSRSENGSPCSTEEGRPCTGGYPKIEAFSSHG